MICVSYDTMQIFLQHLRSLAYGVILYKCTELYGNNGKNRIKDVHYCTRQVVEVIPQS